MKALIAAVAVLIGGAVVGGAAASKPPRTIQTERLEIVDAKGRVRIALDVADSGPRVALLSDSGDARVWIGIYEGDPAMRLSGRRGAAVTMEAGEVSRVGVGSTTDRKASRCSLLSSKDGSAIALFDAHGELIWDQHIAD